MGKHIQKTNLQSILINNFSCIFVWRVPHDMVVTMHARLSQQAMRQGKTLNNEIFSDISDFNEPNAIESDHRSVKIILNSILSNEVKRAFL